MISKKEKILGMELKLALTPSQALRSTFDVRAPEMPTIRKGTEAYRLHVKKRAVRGISFGGLTSGAEKEVLGIRRMKQQRGNQSW